MSRITKDIAHEVARKLTSKKTEEINKIEKELQLKLEGFLLEKVPKEIMDLFKKHPNYFEKTSSFRISGNGFNYEYLQTKHFSKEKGFTKNHYDNSLKALKQLKII